MHDREGFGNMTQMDAIALHAVSKMIDGAKRHLAENPGLTATFVLTGGIEATVDEIVEVDRSPSPWTSRGSTVVCLRHGYGRTARRFEFDQTQIRLVIHEDVETVPPEALGPIAEEMAGRIAALVKDERLVDMLESTTMDVPADEEARRRAAAVVITASAEQVYEPHLERRELENRMRDYAGVRRLEPGRPVDHPDQLRE